VGMGVEHGEDTAAAGGRRWVKWQSQSHNRNNEQFY
jgi:hypothetical protein